MPEQFDLAILGGGSAAFAAAIRASDLGASVVVVNGGTIGGTCVNFGCVPSKTLIRAAENHHQNQTVRFRGLRAGPASVDFGAVVAEKDTLVGQLRSSKYEDILAGLANVRRVDGRGRLLGPGKIEANGTEYRARGVIVATGARPATPPIAGLTESGAWDSTAALAAPFLPERLIVLGGGYVALELSQMFLRFGSRVTLVQRSEQVLHDEDRDVADALAEYLRDEGMDVMLHIETRSVRRSGAAFVVEAVRGGKTVTLEADAVVYGLGRRANTDGIGLDLCGAQVGARGELAVSEALETTCPGVFGAGDVIGDPAFVYAAAYEGALATENALTGQRRERDYSGVPWVIFTDPQVAAVGLNEKQAAARGITVDVAKLPLSLVPRALAAHDTRGFIKVLREKGRDRLVGARVLAPEGGEQIIEASLMLRFGLSVAEVAGHFHPFLTQGEGIKLALQAFERDVERLSCCSQ